MKRLALFLLLMWPAAVFAQNPAWFAFATDAYGSGFSYTQQPDSIYVASVMMSGPWTSVQPPPSAFTNWVAIDSLVQPPAPVYSINTNLLYLDPPVIDWSAHTVTLTVHNANPLYPTHVLFVSDLSQPFDETNAFWGDIPAGQSVYVFRPAAVVLFGIKWLVREYPVSGYFRVSQDVPPSSVKSIGCFTVGLFISRLMVGLIRNL